MILLNAVFFSIFFTVNICLVISQSIWKSDDQSAWFRSRSNDRVIHFIIRNIHWFLMINKIVKRNSHIDIRYDDAQFLFLVRHSLFVLQSSFFSWIRALKQILHIQKTFKTHSTRYAIQFVLHNLYFDDMKIVSLKDEEKIFVELKSKHFRKKLDFDFEIEVFEHDQKNVEMSDKSVFVYKMQWDYLYSIIKHNSNFSQMLFASRDLIFFFWWNASVNVKNEMLQWSVNHKIAAKKFIIDTSDSKHLIKKMIAIIQEYDNKAHISVLISFSHVIWKNTRRLIKFHDFDADVSSSRDSTYQMMTYQRLMQICRK